MCEQCCAKADEYGQDAFIPGLYLCRATQDGYMMKAGDWGIVECNDPSFIFHTTPIKNPYAGMDDEQIDGSSDEMFAEFNRFVDISARIMDEIKESVEGGFALNLFGRLYIAMCNAGFNPDKDNIASAWLCHRLACFIEENPNPRKHYSGIPPVDEGNSDPVFQNMVTHMWHFWDETWSDLHGPYETEQKAREACTEYAKTV